MNQRHCEEILDDENRGKLLLNIRRVIRHSVHFLRVTDPFITAHHPSCGHFDGHVLTLRRRKWCIGCTFNTISFFGAMTAIFLIWMLDSTLLVRRQLFWIGVIASIIYFLSSLSGALETRKRAKVLSKFLLGSGFACISWSILLYEGLLSSTLTVKLLIIVLLYFGFITILNAKRSIEIFRECERCEFKMRWSKCPGFRELACKLIDEGFLYADEPE